MVSDGPVTVSRQLPADGVAFHEIWNTTGAPALITAVEQTDPTERELAVPPPPQGTKIRINEFAPGHLNERGLQSPVHRTASIDYGIGSEEGRERRTCPPSAGERSAAGRAGQDRDRDADHGKAHLELLSESADAEPVLAEAQQALTEVWGRCARVPADRPVESDAVSAPQRTGRAEAAHAA